MRLDRESAEVVRDVLRGAPATATPSSLAVQILRALPAPAQEEFDVEGLIATLLSLYSLQASLESTPEDLAESLVVAMNASGDAGLAVPVERREQLKNSLVDLLSVPSMSTVLKAEELVSEHPRIFCSARVLTDVRPMFADDLEEPPMEALIIHTLRMSYHADNRLERFFVAMHDRDLDTLIAALTRAKAKSDTVRKMLDTAQIPYPREA